MMVALIVLAGVLGVGHQQRAGGPPQTGTAFLAGQVLEAGSNRPVPGARVAMFSNRGARPEAVFADAQGRFFFANLPAGTYTIDAAMAGYQAATTGPSRAIPLADGERVTTARLRLVKLAVLSGTVRDDAGDPATGTEIIALRRGVVNGRAELVRSGQTRADDRGAYRISGLRPGEYIVCACARDVIPFDGVLLTTIASQPSQLLALAARAIKQGSDVAGLDDTLRTYPPTFYPNSTTIAHAERVAIGPGEDKTGLDISVTAVRAARVSGTVTGAPGPTTAAWIRLVPAGEGDDSAAIGAIPPMLVQPDGRFDFAGVPPGQYVLKARHLPLPDGVITGPSGAALALAGNRGAGPMPPTRTAEGVVHWAEEAITVSGADVRGLSVPLRPGPRLTGRMEFTGNQAPPPPEALSKAGIGFSSTGASPEIGIARVAADATFVVDGVMPGSYIVSARMTLPGWVVKSVTLAGTDITDLPIDVSSRDVNGLVITYSDAPAGVLTGTLVGQSGALTEDLTALVFPVDRRYWASPLAANRRFRAMAIGAGTFSVAGLGPGDYFVVAVPDDAVADWQDARRLEGLARTAERVAVPESGKASVTIRR